MRTSTRATIVFLSILTLAVRGMAAERQRAVTQPSGAPIVLGGLFSLTGDGATLGKASAAALQLAARDINQELADLQLPYHVEYYIADTRLSPPVAQTKLIDLSSAGATIVIGPQSSAEAAAVKDYANAHGILLISQGSTASSLAIAGDNLFRLAPNDKLEGAAIAALMRTNGIDTIVPMWRNDAGNGGLHDSTKTSFEAAGGSMLTGVSYDPATTNFSAPVTSLGAAVRTARNANPAAHIGVYLASFEEAASIFDLARLDADLAGVRWYGGDGVVQSQALIATPAIAAFGVKTSFTAPNVGLDESLRDRWQPLSDEIKGLTGFAPDAYSLSVYDAAWVGVLSTIESSSTPALRKASFIRNVQRYLGLTGSTALDAAGDRKSASFDYWTITDNAGHVDWLRTGQYSGGRVVGP